VQTNGAAIALGRSSLLGPGLADVARIRRRTTKRRLIRAIIVVYSLAGLLAYLELHGLLHLPPPPPNADIWGPGAALVVLFAIVLLVPMLGTGRSPHVMIRPEHLETGLSDIRGLDAQVDEVVRTLNVFLGYATFRDVLGGTPRRGILFEGPPGTGKTYLAKAMAKQAGVPFMFVSAPAFQSMFFGMTNVKIRTFFRGLRKAARKEGGAIGFIDEIDAIGGARDSLSMSPAPALDESPSRSVSAFQSNTGSSFVNELLIQMQSFDQPPWPQRTKERLVEWVNGYLPQNWRLKTGRPAYHNILLIAATNRADALDPALVRPGRFDRRLYFDLPTKQGRRDLIDWFLSRKAHDARLDEDAIRERLAHDTFGYTPVMVEHLFDEALLLALRSGQDGMTLSDVYEAKLTEEVGLPQATAYTDEERNAVATHEAGHAVAAFLLGTTRRMEVLSIIKRRASLGLLAHTDLEERFTQTRSELEAAVAIALGGMAAEELFLGETGTGPGSDLSSATAVAALMVGSLGMAGSLVSYEAVAEGIVARKNLVGKVLGDADAKHRVESLLQAQKDRVQGVLAENQDLVRALRDALIEQDELVGEEILQVIHKALACRQDEGGGDPLVLLLDEPTETAPPGEPHP